VVKYLQSMRDVWRDNEIVTVSGEEWEALTANLERADIGDGTDC
jgi:hypothetical protein